MVDQMFAYPANQQVSLNYDESGLNAGDPLFDLGQGFEEPGLESW